MCWEVADVDSSLLAQIPMLAAVGCLALTGLPKAASSHRTTGSPQSGWVAPAYLWQRSYREAAQGCVAASKPAKRPIYDSRPTLTNRALGSSHASGAGLPLQVEQSSLTQTQHVPTSERQQQLQVLVRWPEPRHGLISTKVRRRLPHAHSAPHRGSHRVPDALVQQREKPNNGALPGQGHCSKECHVAGRPGPCISWGHIRSALRAPPEAASG